MSKYGTVKCEFKGNKMRNKEDALADVYEHEQFLISVFWLLLCGNSSWFLFFFSVKVNKSLTDLCVFLPAS